MKVNLETFEEISEAPSTTDSEYFNEWLMIEEGSWTQDCKYQLQECIVQHVPTDKYYRYSISRSGSPFSDWEYDYRYDGYVELVEVEKHLKVVTTYEWVRVK